MKRYSADTLITSDDFEKCGWLEIINREPSGTYWSMWKSLSSAAEQAIDENRLSEGKVLWLLAEACSMVLKPSSYNEPFMPYGMCGDLRTLGMEDFLAEDINFFAEIADKISEPLLGSRISDLTWLMKKPRDPSYALLAIDNYRKIPIDFEVWCDDGRDCWERVIRLCISLKRGAGDKLKEIETDLLTAFDSVTTETGNFGFWIAELIGLCIPDEGNSIIISKNLENLALGFDNSGDVYTARDYYEAASDWYGKYNDVEKSTEMIVKAAETIVKEAEASLTSEKPRYGVAATLFEKAIQKYRTIPKSRRNANEVDVRIDELLIRLKSAGEDSLSEMGLISSGSINIQELINESEKIVSGKSAQDALLSLANIYRGAQVTSLRELSQEMLNKYPLQAFISAVHVSSDGRVIGKRPGLDRNSPDNEETLWPEMVRYYGMELGFAVRGRILPGLETIRREHRLGELDFYSVTRQSPLVPPGRELLFAKALFAGYDGDFITALHIIVPQIENLVRFQLKQVDVLTTNLDSRGIQQENGLSSLIENAEVTSLFGEDLAFELKALFCDSFGPNLRNQLAHGLIGFDESHSIFSVYAWWFGLRLVINTWWNSLHNPKGQKEEVEEDETKQE